MVREKNVDRFPGMARHSAGVVRRCPIGQNSMLVGYIDETISTDDAVNDILHHLDKMEASVNITLMGFRTTTGFRTQTLTQ